jgi:hypothetical protein
MKGISFLRSMCGKESLSISGMFMFAMTSLNRSSCSQIIDSAKDATSVVVTVRETQYINNFSTIWHLDKFYKSLPNYKAIFPNNSRSPSCVYINKIYN